MGLSSAVAFDSGNLASGIAAATASLDSAIKAYGDYTTPAAQDAFHDIGESVDEALGFDPDWAAMFADVVHRDSPDAAAAEAVYRQLTYNADVLGIGIIHHH